MYDISVCSDCKFFSGGTCRRNPPQVTLNATDNQHPIFYQTETIWPWVSADDWCGEFMSNTAEAKR